LHPQQIYIERSIPIFDIMSVLKCPSCGRDAGSGPNCAQCGAQLPNNSAGTADADQQFAKMIADLKEATENVQEALTPVRTTSFNGCGVMLLDYRPVEDGNYEATRWITIAGMPIFPLGVWKIQPRKYTHQFHGEKQFFSLLGKSRITVDRFFRPYLILAGGALPLYLAYLFLPLPKIVYFLSHLIGTWFAVGLTIVLIILLLWWIGYVMTRFHNADRAYKKKVYK
jgi:hypothetical protein